MIISYHFTNYVFFSLYLLVEAVKERDKKNRETFFLSLDVAACASFFSIVYFFFLFNDGIVF